MFTGLVEEIGTVRKLQGGDRYRRIEIEARTVLDGCRTGDSLAVDGVCQTVTGIRAESFEIESLAETLTKTTFAGYRPGRRVNLERAKRLGDRLDGHLVQGHVNCTARITGLEQRRENLFLTLDLPPEALRYCVAEGSLCVDGISLTIAAVDQSMVGLNIIPATWRATVLADRRAGDRVNIETDMIGRYLARLIGADAASPERGGINASVLKRYGFS